MLHIAYKRSDVAHARIKSIDTSAAEAMEGVEAVFTGKQIAELLHPIPYGGPPGASPDHPAVAVSKINYGGEPVAVVIAADRYLARDAADAIVVDYDVLPAVVDAWKAMEDGTQLIHENFKNNLAVPMMKWGTGADMKGNADDSALDKAFAEADVVIKQRMWNHRLVPNAMEPRGVVAHFEPGKGR